jgi:hypothetical protein
VSTIPEFDDEDYIEDLPEDGKPCIVCDHFINYNSPEDIYRHHGHVYCEECFLELDLYPSDTFWTVDEQVDKGFNVEEFLGEDPADQDQD